MILIFINFNEGNTNDHHVKDEIKFKFKLSEIKGGFRQMRKLENHGKTSWSRVENH